MTTTKGSSVDVNHDGQILNSSVIVGRDDGYHRLIRIDGIDILSPAASEETRLIPPVAWCEYVRSSYNRIVGAMVEDTLHELAADLAAAAEESAKTTKAAHTVQDPVEYIEWNLEQANLRYDEAVNCLQLAEEELRLAAELTQKWKRLAEALKEGDKNDE